MSTDSGDVEIINTYKFQIEILGQTKVAKKWHAVFHKQFNQIRVVNYQKSQQACQPIQI